jgi:membrane associated rhomboid family serine protease
VLSALFLRSNYISVGASGALFGLLGSMLSELIMNWTIYSNKVSTPQEAYVYCFARLCFSLCFFFFAKFQAIRTCRQRQS